MAPKYQPSVAIIGGGLSGITLAINIKNKLGLETFTIYERDPKKVGGTWAANIYPGCACDVPSHWYSLSTELNPNWSEVYSSQPEIHRYWEHVHRKHQLARYTRYDSKFINAEWDPPTAKYTIHFEKTSDGTKFDIVADVLISCIGGFSTPLDKPPGLAGILDYKGEMFHSAKWNYNVNLKGKRVGVIGNGCSAAQFVPKLVEDKDIHVLNFSRTPSWFFPRGQHKYSPLTKWVFANVPLVMRAHRAFIAGISDVRWLVWRLEWAPIRHIAEEIAVRHIVNTAPKKYHHFLIPNYPFGCKRIILDPGYLECLNEENVELITDGIDTITEKGIRGKSGKEYEFDVLILGTGFDVSEVGLGIEVRGSHGKTVTEQWKEQNGPQSYLGTSLAGFPNFFTVLGPNVATGHASVIYSTESQVNYIIKMLEPMCKYGVQSWELKADAEEVYNKKLHKKLDGTVWQGGCKSYYKLGDKVIATYPGTLTQFWWNTRTPIWSHYLQRGGTRRVALWAWIGRAVRYILFVLAIVQVRRHGFKNLRNRAALFALMRYQDVVGLIRRD